MTMVFKFIKWLLVPLLSGIIIISLFYLMLYSIQSGWFDTTESDVNLIKTLEFYSKEDLPSCEVLKKKNKSGYYSITIYKTDSVDFMKAFNAFDTNAKFITLHHNDLMIETKQLIAKTLRKVNKKRESANIVVYKDEKGNHTYKIGFIHPDIIIIEKINKYPNS